MGTNTQPKPDQLGEARPAHSAEDTEHLADDGVWTWEGHLLDLADYAFSGRINEVPINEFLTSIRDGNDVVVALQNQMIGRLPAEPATAVSQALHEGRGVSIRVIETAVDPEFVRVSVRVEV